MPTTLTIRVRPAVAASDELTHAAIAEQGGWKHARITGWHLRKKSIDARGGSIFYNLRLDVFVDEPFFPQQSINHPFDPLHQPKHRVIVIGAGPAGLFAALQLIQHGIQPIVLERGKDVRSRRRDLAQLNREGIVDPNSNYCFGEGGAGTYSDGKLYTRSNKRGNMDRILQLFVQFGADERILYEAHPHIGTNKLPHIITAMREQIRACGGEVHFEQQVTDFTHADGKLQGVRTASGEQWKADAVILATGHSARDIFELLAHHQIRIEAKPFALGVRIEHPQELIDRIQYHCPTRDPLLPPASYSLVEQVEGRGVFSFCMCPGGIIAPAATAPGEIVVNGWSPSKRNNPHANSGMVVQVSLEDAYQYFRQQGIHVSTNDPLLLLRFQKAIEQQCFVAGGGNLQAPAQRVVDFCTNKNSSTLPNCSYQPGVVPVKMQDTLPAFVHHTLARGLQAFGRKLKGYYTNEALVVATESRTSSPVRIPRDADTLMHPELAMLYPCGEGAGYAGGIVSAAMDGERVANQIAVQLLHGR